jgi:Asp-tRNA(Asn)/Glu-tRNA(Gln) amidotransferase A subunit family amidase
MDAIGPHLAAVRRCAKAIDDWEPVVRAWVRLDLDAAVAAAQQADLNEVRALSGNTLGIKDIYDTAEQPTSYGSPLYKDHQPRADAAAVVLLKRSGAIALGKTVTAEFAYAHPGPTRNPRRPTHTPGGSSMGSAAAVACGMTDVALGTQTSASITRPASFCGVYGFKPTYGAVSVAGVKLVAPSLDTVGWFARDPRVLDAAHVSLTAQLPAPTPTGPPRLALARTPNWAAAMPDSQAAVLDAITAARELGALILPESRDDVLDGLVQAHLTVLTYEAARSLSWEHQHRHALSPQLLALLDSGLDTPVDDYDAARLLRDHAQRRVSALFGDADILLAPAAVGEAPAGLSGTGDPLFGRVWSLLGLPTLAIPFAIGSTGLPVGIQAVARPGHDRDLLSFATWFSGGVAAEGIPSRTYA